MEQNGGCDYTIGCGLATREIEAPSMEMAIQEVIGLFNDGELRSDIDNAKLYQFSAEYSIDMSAYQEMKKQKKELKKRLDAEKKDQVEFERLRKKFEKPE